MRLIDWREASPSLLADIWHDQIVRWSDRLAWDSAANWAEVELQRRAGRLPGLILLDDSRIYGWTFFVVHHDTLQIGAFEADSSASTRTLLDAVLGTAEPEIAPAGVMLFAFSAAPGLVPALVARGFETEPYGYLVRDVADADPPARTTPWSSSIVEQLPRLLARAYGEPVLTRPFVRQGSESEWAEYAWQLTASPACGRFESDLSAVHLSSSGELEGAVITTVVAPGTAHIAQVAVAPEQRGRGLASTLLHDVIARVKQAGMERVSLLVSERNQAACRIYRRAGFSETASFISAGRSSTTKVRVMTLGTDRRRQAWR